MIRYAFEVHFLYIISFFIPQKQTIEPLEIDEESLRLLLEDLALEKYPPANSV